MLRLFNGYDIAVWRVSDDFDVSGTVSLSLLYWWSARPGNNWLSRDKKDFFIPVRFMSASISNAIRANTNEALKVHSSSVFLEY